MAKVKITKWKREREVSVLGEREKEKERVLPNKHFFIHLKAKLKVESQKSKLFSLFSSSLKPWPSFLRNLDISHSIFQFSFVNTFLSANYSMYLEFRTRI